MRNMHQLRRLWRAALAGLLLGAALAEPAGAPWSEPIHAAAIPRPLSS